ncbi:hypothetical protein EVAR_102465_1 [Eumeta japonica]|uniref:Uncharacterized protein n=1 Tax=Eumeta variegata TaxID=151549 RepID=A0A4C1ZVI5_EUMVA|nr:hypothetical protein EVAR_102465_1 [Eumeta japonica]
MQKGSSRSVEHQVSPVPPFGQGRTDFALNTASVGVDLRPDHRETVHRLGVEVLDALVPDLGHAQGSKSPKYTGLSSSRSTKVSLSLSALHLIQPGRLPLPMSRGSSLERISANAGTLYGEPGTP